MDLMHFMQFYSRFINLISFLIKTSSDGNGGPPFIDSLLCFIVHEI